MAENNKVGFGEGYDAVDDAAAAALLFLNDQPRIDDQEYLTILFRDPKDKKIYRTNMATSGLRGSVKQKDARFSIPKGAEVVGTVHNHPTEGPHAEFDNRRLSDTDVQQLDALNQSVGYLLARRKDGKHEKLRFDPKTSKVERHRNRNSGGSRELGVAEPFLAQFPMKELNSRLMRKLLDRAPNDPRGLRRDEVVPTRNNRNILAQ